MTKTIQAALVPLLIIAFLCGLALFEYPLGRPRLHFTLLYLLITWSFYIYIFHYIINTSYMTYVFMSLPNLTIMCFAIVNIFVSLFRYEKLKICLCKLSTVNDTLEMLGISKEYQWLHNWTIRKAIGLIALICFINTLDGIWLNHDDSYSNVTRFFAPFVGNYCFVVNIINNLMWEIILGHVHLQLCLISRELNKIFSIQMTLQMACYFTIFVELSRQVNTIFNWATASFGQILFIFCTCLWILICSAKVLIFNYICQIVYDKTKETLTLLYKLSNNNLDNDLREQTLQFILQIKHREVKFSGMGLFNFGYNFVRQFYVSIATVMIITIQMRFSITYSRIFPLINEKK